MRNILVLTDFSDNAYNALFYVSKLFSQRECNFFLLNAYKEKTSPADILLNGGEEVVTMAKGKSKEGLENTFHKINLDNPNPKHLYQRLSENMDLIAAAKKAIKEFKIDLLVLGNKGTSSLISVFWGSTAIRVMTTIKNCPILAVPDEKEFRTPSEIAFATNYRRSFDAAVMAPVRFMTSISGGAVRIVHINEEKRLSKFQESNLNTLITYLKPLEHTVHWMPNFTSKTKAIQVFLGELDIGMLAMVNYEHSFLEFLLREPVIPKMTFHITIPFLVIPGD
ncbi:universal stress protein [Ulvibacterium sp.]|uniref:universal stress protein n=1 Tax=Ulvibacterium sp. TaxID=2665914 RepID=UPI0026032697|nr:universal stress protein [Ulvibacterium sp.]